MKTLGVVECTLRLRLFRCKMFSGKHFFYFLVFGMTGNHGQTEDIFGWLRKPLIFVKWFPFFKTVNHFSSLSFFLHALFLAIHSLLLLESSEICHRLSEFITNRRNPLMAVSCHHWRLLESIAVFAGSCRLFSAFSDFLY